jgi:serine/threonine protein kinase
VAKQLYLFLHLYQHHHHHLVTVSEFVNGGELLGLCQSYGLLPEELVQIYVAEISLAIGKLFSLVHAGRTDLFSYFF